MKTLWLSWLVVLLIGPLAQARDYQFFVFVGPDVQLENDSQFNSWSQNFLAYGAGIKIGDLVFDLQSESASLSSSSGGLSIQQNSTEYSFETLYTPHMDWYALPYLGGGFGVLSESLDTQLLGSKSHDVGDPDYFLMSNLGIRINSEIFWVSAEMRLLFFDRHEPNPALSWLGRVGILF